MLNNNLVVSGVNLAMIAKGRLGDWGTGGLGARRKKWYAYFRRLVLVPDGTNSHMIRIELERGRNTNHAKT